jgi:hypothetical protein
MSEITQNFVVEPNNINITVDTNNINFTPNTTQLSIFTSAPATVGGSNTQLQYNNNNQFGGIPNVTWNGSNISLGNVANIKITGGTNGFVLETDGTGNLSWTAQTGNGGGGNGTPGGANTQIQYNDSGSFGGNVGFTFDEITGNVNLPNNLIVVGNISGTFIGNIANAVNANFANFAGVVTTNAQPNITGVGTLSSLNVTNNITSTSGIYNGNGSGLYAIAGANVTGIVTNATYANYANYGGNLIINTGNFALGLNAGNVAQANYAIALGFNAGNTPQGNGSIAIGANTGFTNQGGFCVAIGKDAGEVNQGTQSIAIGLLSGTNAQGNYTVAIGTNSGANLQGANAVAIGVQAGSNTQGANSVAVGYNAGNYLQKANAVAIGYKAAQGDQAGTQFQGNGAISIGAFSCEDNGQGDYAISIGYQTGKNISRSYSVAVGALIQQVATNTIALNSTGSNMNATTANAFFVKPIRDVTGNAAFTVQLYYNPTTGEIGYK